MKDMEYLIDPETIKRAIKDRDLTYQKIQLLSGGIIKEGMLKHILNNCKVPKIDEKTLDFLANLLHRDKYDLVDKSYRLSENLPSDVNRMIDDLYIKNREDINSYYEININEFRRDADLKTILLEGHCMFQTIATVDYFFDKTAFVKTFNKIGTDFIKNNCIANMHLTGLRADDANDLYSKIVKYSGEYNTQQAILMFLYVFILFDAIFLEEAVASACQLVPERKTEKADQYFSLTYRSEIMRDALINYILYKGILFDDPSVSDLGLDDQVIKGIMLLLAACEKCYLHLNGPYKNSEYVNRASLSAILTNLENIFETVGIKLPDFGTGDHIFNMMYGTRFGRNYNMLKMAFNLLNPPRKPRNKEIDGYNNGFNNGVAVGLSYRP